MGAVIKGAPMEAQIQNLQSGLKEFGLNPDDWWVQPTNDNEFLIYSKFDGDFVLHGNITEDQNLLRWERLQVISL